MDGQQGGRMDKPGGSPHLRFLSNPLMGDVLSDWSPLHDAAIHGCLLTLRNLISQGWPVNIITADHVSPLHEACLRGHLPCATVLLSHGAQVNNMSIDWRTPLFNACVNGSQDCVNLLLDHGAIPHPESDLASPIHEAAKRGHVKCIESLVAHGANIDHNISHLGSPLYVACKNQQIACAKKLLQAGASVNEGKGLDSPLHIVAKMCIGELVHLLIDFGANPQARNAEGKRPVDLVPPDSPLIQIFLEREGPQSLMQLCRLRIRKCFGIWQHHKITGLFLPEDLKRFLLHL
ncbi:ankyrin repeat and SOCS box protein 9 [Peromyscus eremicus]|uniref:ankyrin repeat and SOCS box protein 9 n=1 Tax=Peromyscus eremicus TaxID=42410 RepID=UPI0027DD8E1B|nr:ankyrin repeat and SOCS box protein 9 [Peromyscus eremicus]XP_059106249.1 ankyrin repeat and SOCS box protein 9 [Peromyscus eremicus]XP_059106250.1 ankyrin repeat and SOCS box protein 9 [Peromyscus eremicus]